MAEIRDTKFAAFEEAIADISVQPAVFTHPDFEILLFDASQLRLRVVDVLVEGIDSDTAEELAGLIDAGRIGDLLERLRQLALTVNGIEFYTSNGESIWVYGSGLTHLEGSPIRDSRWNDLVSKIVVHVVQRA